MASTQATAMSGGTSYLLKETVPNWGNSAKKVQLYLYVKESPNTSTRQTTLYLGLYVVTPSGWSIGPWKDYGNSKLNGSTFDGYIPNFAGTWWLVSNKTLTVSHDDAGNAAAQSISWYWDVHSSWGGFYDANGSKSVSVTKMAAKTYTVSYNANGGSGAPSAQTKTYGTALTLSSTQPIRSGYRFAGWNTNAAGTGTSYAAGGSYTANAGVTLYAQWTVSTTACAAPTSLAISNSTTNNITCSCKVGTSGTGNNATGVDFYITFDGSTPSTSNYHYTVYVAGSASASVSTNINLASYSQPTWEAYFGTDCIGTVKAVARTRGAAGSSYYSGTTSVASNTSITYKGAPKAPAVITSPKGKVIKGKNSSDSCTLYWNAATAGVNDTVGSYTVYVYNASTDALVTSYNTGTSKYKNVPNSVFTAGNTYYFKVRATSAASGLYIDSLKSGLVEFKNITALSTPVLTITNAGTVPTTSILGSETFLNIGTGDVLKFSWSPVSGTNNEISYYYLYLYPASDDPYYANNTGGYFSYSFYSLANECYVPASALASGGPGWHKFTYYLYPNSKYGSYYNSQSVTGTCTFINGCSGAYIKLDSTNSDYPQPVMKRAVAFVKDQASGEWKLCQGAFYKDPASNEWKTGDISYEVLMDQNGEIITDSDNSPIYTL